MTKKWITFDSFESSFDLPVLQGKKLTMYVTGCKEDGYILTGYCDEKDISYVIAMTTGTEEQA